MTDPRSSIWTGLVESIIIDHQFPPNTPLTQAYQATPGATSHALDIYDPADQLYIKQFWQAFLAPRQCSSTWQCQLFLRHGEPLCVFSTLGYQPWLNGLTPGDGITGKE